jgi:hypothetical protein
MHLCPLRAKWRKGKRAVVFILRAWEKEVPTLFKYLPGPLGPDEAGCRGSHLGPSIEGERARETRARSLLAREVLKRRSVTEIRPEFTPSWARGGPGRSQSCESKPEVSFQATHLK